MTIEEKAKRIEDACKNRICIGCPLYGYGEACCEDLSVVDRNYKDMFGDEAMPDPAANPVNDPVNHPAHYTHGKHECIDVMCEAIGEDHVKSFCLCNAFKYLYRCNSKHDTPEQDVSKAIWYLNKFLELERKEND